MEVYIIRSGTERASKEHPFPNCCPKRIKGHQLKLVRWMFEATGIDS